MPLGLIFESVMENFVAIRSAVIEKMTLKFLFLVIFSEIPELKLSIVKSRKAGYDVQCLYILQSKRFVLFVNVSKFDNNPPYKIEYQQPIKAQNS